MLCFCYSFTVCTFISRSWFLLHFFFQVLQFIIVAGDCAVLFLLLHVYSLNETEKQVSSNICEIHQAFQTVAC